MWALFRGRGLGTHCFQQMEVVGVWERVCACVLRGASGVCFSSVCQQANFPLIWAAKMTRHTRVCTFTLSLSYLSINSSIHSFSLPLPDKLIHCVVVVSLVTESIVTWCTALIPLCFVYIFTGFKDGDMTTLTQCRSTSEPLLWATDEKKEQNLKESNFTHFFFFSVSSLSCSDTPQPCCFNNSEQVLLFLNDSSLSAH